MNAYLMVKWLHVVSATVLFGTGIGIAFFKWIVDRSDNVAAIRVVSEKIVLADWLFTTPAIVIQFGTGIYLAGVAEFPIARGWLLYAIVLFFIAGACWLPVVWLQIRMRDLARIADRSGAALPPAFHRCARIWFSLGVPAFGALLVVLWLMVVKPG